MTLGCALGAAWLATATGCEPPPAVEGGGTMEPEVRLLYPDADVPITLDPVTGNLKLLIVVDLVGITFNDPGLAEQITDGEGHYHVSLNDVSIDAPPNLWYEIDEEGWSVGDAGKLTVSLQDNEHGDLDQYTLWQDIFEFTVQ
jgi:hypothetical protein